MLIASRALLGIAGATIAPSTLSLIRNMFHDDAQRTVAIGVWITAFSLGGALGPLFGGVLLEFFWWGSVFLLAVPVMALLLVLGPLVLPEYRDPEAGRLDLVSAALSLVAVLAVVYGLKEFARDGYGVEPTTALLVGLAVGAVFVRRQQRLAEPLIDLGLFRVRAFSAFAGRLHPRDPRPLRCVLLHLPVPAARRGLVTAPRRRRDAARSSAAFIVGAMLAPAIVKRVSPADVMAGGPRTRHDRLRHAYPGRGGFRRRPPRRVHGGLLARPRAALHAHERPHHRFRATRARGCGFGNLRDRRRARRGARRSHYSARSAPRSTGIAWTKTSPPASPTRASRLQARRSAARSPSRTSFLRGVGGRASRGGAERVHRRPPGERARERRHRGGHGCAWRRSSCAA